MNQAVVIDLVTFGVVLMTLLWAAVLVVSVVQTIVEAWRGRCNRRRLEQLRDIRVDWIRTKEEK